MCGCESRRVAGESSTNEWLARTFHWSQHIDFSSFNLLTSFSEEEERLSLKWKHLANEVHLERTYKIKFINSQANEQQLISQLLFINIQKHFIFVARFLFASILNSISQHELQIDKQKQHQTKRNINMNATWDILPHLKQRICVSCWLLTQHTNLPVSFRL